MKVKKPKHKHRELPELSDAELLEIQNNVHARLSYDDERPIPQHLLLAIQESVLSRPHIVNSVIYRREPAGGKSAIVHALLAPLHVQNYPPGEAKEPPGVFKAPQWYNTDGITFTYKKPTRKLTQKGNSHV